MKRTSVCKNQQRKLVVNLVHMAWLVFACSASASLTITTINQQGSVNTYPFTPSWTPASDSLILGVAPTVALGNFRLEDTNRSTLSLTAGGSLMLDKVVGNFGLNTTSTNYVTCGHANGAGSLLVYALPPSALGYNLTNITIYSGWTDSGRDSQAFTVLYSTTANPGNFLYLTNVNYNPSVPNQTASANRVMIADSLDGVIAANVAAVKFDFTVPYSENGYTGYGAITVEGTPAASVVTPVVSITTSNQSGASPFSPTWTTETPNLIAGLAATTALGNFTQGGSGGISVLTDGSIGESGDMSDFATCGTNGGTSLIYALTNVANGTDVTNIVVYSGWDNASRDGQYYTVSYSTIAAPAAYTPITTVFYNPQGVSGASANRVAISTSTGVPLANGVANLKFDFSSPPWAGNFDNAYSGISEIIVQGNNAITKPLPDTLPAYAETVVGDQVVFTSALSNMPPATLQWLFISGGVASQIPGATNSTLTLNNVQLTNSGSYQLEAVNDPAPPLYSRAAPLVVGSLPTPVNNVIVEYAGQCGASDSTASFYPSWTVSTNNDLNFGFPVNVPGHLGTGVGTGDFSGGGVCNPDPTILEDGSFGNPGAAPDAGTNLTEVACGPIAGQTMIYDLNTNSAPDGFDVTNITVYGGWADSGRNEQKYQVLYSTMTAPTVFNVMASVDYNPNDPNNTPSATRTTIIPATGVLAQNVAAVEINWNLPPAFPKNGWEGYSEILISGTKSLVHELLSTITPVTAEDVQGSSLTIQAVVWGAASYQWQKNQTNIAGATSSTLTLSNLLLTDTGGYRLVGSSASGSITTRECAVVVDPTPPVINNLVKAFAYQTSDQFGFGPTWDASGLSSSLIYQQNPPSGGYGTGNFNDPYDNPNGMNNAGGLPVLTDGNYGFFTSDGSHPAFATGGNFAGQYVIYTLGTNANGYNVTNIQIAGGWNDSGRDAQWYTVSYSTVANPTAFIRIAVVTNNPPVSDQSVIRMTLTPATGFIASNACAIKVDFATPQGVPNGYSGYSEISVLGSPAPTLPALKPARLSDGDLIMSGTGGTPNSGYTILTTTNLPSALANWRIETSGVTDGTGAFTNAIPVNPSQPETLFRLRMP